MEPGALRRRLDDIYLHRRELGAASAPATRTCVAADVAETQPMSEEIRFRLDIWPLQQMGVLADFLFFGPSLLGIRTWSLSTKSISWSGCTWEIC